MCRRETERGRRREGRMEEEGRGKVGAEGRERRMDEEETKGE